MKYEKVKQILFCVLLLAAVGSLVFGLFDGGFADVLQKARMICFECIGIG
ncbi:MAG: hypothetical protein IKE65_04060 [Clostridia bacterium]|nr:hypothetical protein [Clostridia bacterium]